MSKKHPKYSVHYTLRDKWYDCDTMKQARRTRDMIVNYLGFSPEYVEIKRYRGEGWFTNLWKSLT